MESLQQILNIAGSHVYIALILWSSFHIQVIITCLSDDFDVAQNLFVFFSSMVS